MRIIISTHQIASHELQDNSSRSIISYVLYGRHTIHKFAYGWLREVICMYIGENPINSSSVDQLKNIHTYICISLRQPHVTKSMEFKYLQISQGVLVQLTVCLNVGKLSVISLLEIPKPNRLPTSPLTLVHSSSTLLDGLIELSL